MDPNQETLQGEVRVGDKKHCFIQLEGTIALLTLAPTVRYTAGHGPFPVDSTSSTALPHSPTSPTLTAIMRPIYHVSASLVRDLGWGLISKQTD